MTVGEKIRIRRLELRMTMEELGEAVGVQRSAINKYEKNMVELKASQIRKISKALDVSVFYLLDDDETPSEEDRLLIAFRGASREARKNALLILESSAAERRASKQDTRFGGME